MMGLHNPYMTLKRFMIENAQQLGVVIATWYELFSGENVELLAFKWAQTNTTPQAQLVDVRVTIDGEAMTAIGVNPNSGEINKNMISNLGQPLVTNPFLDEFLEVDSVPFAFLFDDGGVFMGVGKHPSGRVVTIELRITDAVGANQQLDMDIVYHQYELG